MKLRQLLMPTIFIGTAILGLAPLATGHPIDAMSGASIQILGGTTTDVSATVNWKVTNGDARGNGTMTLYMNTVNNGTSSKSMVIPSSARSAERTSASYTITGLTPATKYFFWMRITSGSYLATGGTDTLRTEPKSSSILGLTKGAAPQGQMPVDVMGRRLPSRGFAPVRFSSSGAQIQPSPSYP